MFHPWEDEADKQFLEDDPSDDERVEAKQQQVDELSSQEVPLPRWLVDTTHTSSITGILPRWQEDDGPRCSQRLHT